MTQEHPITPPPELVRQWAVYMPGHESPEQLWLSVATQAARWGADQELKACCVQLRCWGVEGVDNLRATRRPKPPSLKQQALTALEQLDGWAVANMSQLTIHDDLVAGVDTIRRALEALPDD